ncbi:MAG: hypothetical protein LKG11_01320 [Bacilli bacterium]|jgi:hypothetical protein|nr:hypothetical protein [Bacilli bacterium]
MRVFRYEFELLKKRKWAFLLIGLLVAMALLLLAFSPILSRERIGGLGYSEGMSLESVLGEYRTRYDAIQSAVDSGEMSVADAAGPLRLLSFFLSTKSTEYECLPYADLFLAREGMLSLSSGLSILEGGAFINAVVATSLGSYLFAAPAHKGRIRPMVESGCDRASLLWGKAAFGLFWLFSLWIVVSVVGLSLAGPFLGERILLAYRDSYVYVPVWSAVFSRIIGMTISGCFFFALSSLLGLCLRMEAAAFALPSLSLILFFLLSNTSAPSFGDYGQLSGIGGWLLLCMPFSDIVVAPSFGLLSEIWVLFAVYAVIVGLLVCASLRRVRRMAL